MPVAFIRWFTVVTENLGAFGSVLATMGCAMCFPAAANLGAAFGLGFLAQWEGYLVNILLPALAWGLLPIHALAWFAHHQSWRSLLGMTGPALLLISLYPLFQYRWSSYVTYGALTLMVVIAIQDLWSQKSRRCETRQSHNRSPGNEGVAS